ncbi:something about silencing protein 10 [Lecanora helva]
MGKKRKVNKEDASYNEHGQSNSETSKLRINTYEDVADSEDEFHINRDKILFEEGPVQKKQRQLREEEEFLEPSDEEVLAASEDFSDSDDEFEEAQENLDPPRKQPRLAKSGAIPQDLESEPSERHEEDEDAGGWGTSRNDYYDADAIETEADALGEETEVKRLEHKRRQGMTEADFGFDEVEWLEASKDGEKEDNVRQGMVIREVLPKLQITDVMEPKERMKILTRYPEFEPLAGEFVDLQPLFDDLKTRATQSSVFANRKEAESSASVEDEEFMPLVAVVKHSVLAAYLAALSMYFAIFTSGPVNAEGVATAMPPGELRDHPIMGTLVQCRELWQRVKDMAELESDSLDNYHEEDVLAGKGNEEKVDRAQAVHHGRDEKLRKPRNRKSKAQKAAEVAQAEANALRAEKLRKTEEELADLSALTAQSKIISKSKIPPTNTTIVDGEDNSDFGEQTSLTPQEASEKAKRKKSLRFYTSQIAQKANKRDAAGRDAGGDTDLPYRERLKDRQARLNAEAERRGKKPKAGEELDGLSDEEGHGAVQELRNGDGGSDSEDYYDLVAARAASKRADKAARASAYDQLANGGFVRQYNDEIIGEDGKRAINYQIEKNKGITPKRKKDVRNPRVKKRKKFEDKRKKLGSVRAVYKGGEGRGGYGGELTGIKKGLVRSVKL